VSGISAVRAGTVTIALKGQSAPGTGGGTFLYFGSPTLNAAGQVAFHAGLTGTSDGSSEGHFRGDGTTTAAIARGKWAAPGTGGGTFASFGDSALNASGQAAFSASLTGTTDGSTNGMFRGDGTTISAFAREKSAAPGTGGGTFVGLSGGALNASGQVAFRATLTGTTDGSDEGVFRGSGTTTTAIAREKWAAPGTGGGTYSSLDNAALNASGQAAFWAILTGTTDGSSVGIFRGSGTTTTAIAREKWAAPGTGAGTFAGLSDPALNVSGQAVFSANLTGTSDASSVGIFRGDGTTTTAIAREKWAAPGAGAGTFLSFSYPALNASGQVAFWADLTGTTDGSGSGIFRGDGTTTTAIAREKWAAPGAGGGTFVGFDDPALNASGQVAFRASLADTVGGSADNLGIFLADSQERIEVMRKGALLAGSAVTNLDLYGGTDLGGFSPFNDYGQLAYWAALADGRGGIFLFTPELHWRSASGSWDTAANWTVGLQPAAVHPVIIDPVSTLTVTGPTLAATVKSLTVGAKTYGQTATLTLSSATGALNVTGATTIQTTGRINVNAGTFTTATLNSAGTFVVDVAGTAALGSLTNTGTATVSGIATVTGAAQNQGTLTVQAGGTLTAVGGLVNLRNLTLDGATLAGGTVTNDYGGSMLARGTISTPLLNNGTLGLTGVLTVSGAVTNNGTLSISGAESLRQNATLENYGTITLAGGAVSGTGTATNKPGGIIRGYGALSSAFSNQGQIELGATDTLTISQAFANSGTIALGGSQATLAGGSITNTGTIRGQGQVANPLSNAAGGTLRAEAGVLTLGAAGATNAAGALMEVLADATLLLSQGLATNQGTIVLRDGTFDNSGRTMTSAGTITGHGTIRSGGLTNNATQNIGVGGGNLEVIGPVTNNGTVTTQAACTATFYNRVNGTGSFPGSGTVVFLDGFSPGLSPAAVSFGGSVVFSGTAQVSIELGGTSPGSQYDVISAAGNVGLGGTLQVTLINPPFRPAHNDQFTILTFGSRTGDFAANTGLDLGGRLRLEPQYNANNLALTAVQDGSGTWRFDADGAASVSTNWVGGLPNGVGDVATFGSVIGQTRTVTIDAPTTLGGMVFDNANKYKIGVSGAGQVTLSASGRSATVEVRNGSHEIAAPLVLSSPVDFSVAHPSDTLTITGRISGSSGLTKSGDGILDVLGEIAYGGNTTITGGEMRVEQFNPATAATADVDVRAGARLVADSIQVDTLTLGIGATVTIGPAGMESWAGGNGAMASAGGIANPVPEPGTLVLLALAGTCFLVGRRHRA
jgi:hypothetical protein